MAPVFMGQMPSCHLTNSVKELKEIKALIPTRENHPPASSFHDPLSSTARLLMKGVLFHIYAICPTAVSEYE